MAGVNQKYLNQWGLIFSVVFNELPKRKRRIGGSWEKISGKR
jgi:hypothetical protein